MKSDLIKEIIELGLFKVSSSADKNKWILLKNGSRTPVFLDTAKFISYPELIAKVNKFAVKIIKDNNIIFDRIIGAPYGGLPFCYGIANILQAPCLALRKEGPKNYSTAGELLGIYKKGERVLLIEDATVTANTVIEFVKKLRSQGLRVTDVITILDIEKFAKTNLDKHQIRLHSLFTWKDLFGYYKIKNSRLISAKMRIFLDNFINN